MLICVYKYINFIVCFNLYLYHEVHLVDLQAQLTDLYWLGMDI